MLSMDARERQQITKVRSADEGECVINEDPETRSLQAISWMGTSEQRNNGGLFDYCFSIIISLRRQGRGREAADLVVAGHKIP
jgi:hypothetical protein